MTEHRQVPVTVARLNFGIADPKALCHDHEPCPYQTQTIDGGELDTKRLSHAPQGCPRPLAVAWADNHIPPLQKEIRH